MSGSTLQQTTWPSAVLLLLSFLSSAASAQVRFDLPAEPLSQALKDVAAQADLNIYFDPALVAGLKVSPLRANLTPKAAFERVLNGTRLVAIYVDENTVRVELKDRAEKAGNHNPAITRAADQTRQAQSADPPKNPLLTEETSESPGDARAATAASASSPASDALRTIVVTAQRYAQNPRDVPISMSVFSGVQLSALHVNDLRDLSYVVPSLQVESASFTHYMMIRGMGNIFGSGATIGEYIDEADVAPSAYIYSISMPTIEAYDLQRVEVLRGPQGTLFGSGSLGGTVRFITNTPDLTQFTGSVDARSSVTQDGSPSERVVSVFNTPIAQDVLGVRVASEFDHEGGFLDQPDIGLKNYDDMNTVDARMEGVWSPTKNFNVNVMEIVHRSSFGYNAVTNRQGIYTQVFDLQTNPNGQNHYDLSNIKVTYDFAKIEVLSSTTYLENDTELFNIGQPEPFNGPADVTPEFDQLLNPQLDTVKTFSEDFRFTGRHQGALHWTAGAFYKYNFDQDYFPIYSAIPGPPGTPLPTPFVIDQAVTSRAGSVYADANYRVFGRLTLGAGVRYFRDSQKFTDFSSNSQPGPPAYQSGKFTSTDPRAYVMLQATKDVNVYASAAKGFRSGGFNTYGLPPYEPEEVWSYELGTKARFLGGRMMVDVAGFLVNYSDYTTLIYVPNLAADIYANAGRIQIKGGEATIAWIPGGGWTLRISGDYVNGRYVEIQGESPPNNVGDPIMIAPRYQFSMLARRDFQLLGKMGFVQVDYNQRAKSNIRYRDIGPWYYGESDYLYQLGADLGVNLTDSAQIDVFGQNLLNKHAFINADVVEGSPLSRPRTVGVDVTVKF